MPEVRSAQQSSCQLRMDAHSAHEVDTALSIAASDGIGRALDYMEQHGVAHDVAVRVLAAPHLHRRHSQD